MNIKHASELFIHYCQAGKNLSAHTLKAYQIDLNDFIKYLGSQSKITECDKYKIREFVAYLKEQRKLKESTIKRRLTCIKILFNWMEDEELIKSNPCHRLNIQIKIPDRLPRSLHTEQLQKIFASPQKNLNATNFIKFKQNDFSNKKLFNQLTTLLALEILFSTGIRVGELVSIKQEDISLSEGVIKIIGKGNRQRRVFISSDELHSLIVFYISNHHHHCIETKLLFINSRGTPASTQFIRSLIRQSGKQANLPQRITPHMFRHSCATHLLEEGVDIRFVQRLLGHHCITTTQIYTHVSDNSLKDVISSANIRKRLEVESMDN